MGQAVVSVFSTVLGKVNGDGRKTPCKCCEVGWEDGV